MRPHNSVGGFRIYPANPDFAEECEAAVATLGQFREGLDRLHTDRQLSERQQRQVDQFDLNSERASNYQRLFNASNRIWQLALEKQRALANNEISGPYSTTQLVELLNDYADRWQGFKRQIDEQA